MVKRSAAEAAKTTRRAKGKPARPLRRVRKPRGTAVRKKTPKFAAGQRQLTIRMYNAGFGDCFLITIPQPDRNRKILIDCGKHNLSKCQPPLKDIVKAVQAELHEPDGAGGTKKRIDLLIVTHRHLDHVNGFALGGWDDVEVGEIWMPWTEDPDDPKARRLCEKQSQRALQLQALASRMSLAPKNKSYLLNYAGNNLTNAKAMNRLHTGFQGAPRRHFLPTAKLKKNAIKPRDLPEVTVHVLGPSRSKKVIRDMDPPEGEAYFQLACAEADGDCKRRASPFADKWVLNRTSYERWFVNWLGKDSEFDPLARFSEQTQKQFHNLVEEAGLELATSLEKAVNGTSLVLLFRIGSAVLLFPGDAQWGTWNEILHDDYWRQQLQRVQFYKVGHHGSHNATPRQFVEELLPTAACAMIPTDFVSTWPTIPKQELIKALKKKKVASIRSDRKDGRDPACFRRVTVNGATLYVDLSLPF